MLRGLSLLKITHLTFHGPLNQFQKEEREMSERGKIVIIALLLAFCVFGLSVFSAISETYQKDVLRGLKGLAVVVEDINPDVEKYGLGKNQIKTDIELKLRMAGIEVQTEEKNLKSLGSPFLYIEVGVMKIESMPVYVVTTEVSLGEWVRPERDSTIKALAKTWETGSLGFVGEKELRLVRESIGDSVNKFLNDYLAANPKVK
jgi:hypothetical protein